MTVSPDTTAPTSGSLAAAAVSSLQINLTWTASTDTIGVAGYRVYRNGVAIGTTAAITYADTGSGSKHGLHLLRCCV